MTTAVQLAQSVAPGVSLGFKNRVINGNMTIDQRNAGASVTPANFAYLTDRWQFRASQGSKFTAEQTISGVSAPTGFTDYLGMTSTSAYSVGVSEQFGVRQFIEGLNISDLAWGTASAKAVTLSFWAYSSLTGTHSGALGNSGDSRAYPFSYTISAANTWEYKTITIAGDTSGTWLTTNGIGIKVSFNLGAGSSMLATAGAWTTGEIVGATGSVSVVGTNGATFYITGVQLEVGTAATSFEFRDYGRELRLCQRYYQKSFLIDQAPSTSNALGYLELMGARHRVADVLGFRACAYNLQVEMRDVPTYTQYNNAASSSGTARLLNYDGSTQDIAIGFWYGNSGTKVFYPVIYTGVSIGSGGMSVSAGFNFTASAEL